MSYFQNFKLWKRFYSDEYHCGSETPFNRTYFTNPHFPHYSEDLGLCDHTITKARLIPKKKLGIKGITSFHSVYNGKHDIHPKNLNFFIPRLRVFVKYELTLKSLNWTLLGKMDGVEGLHFMSKERSDHCLHYAEISVVITVSPLFFNYNLNGMSEKFWAPISDNVPNGVTFKCWQYSKLDAGMMAVMLIHVRIWDSFLSAIPFWIS